MENLSITQHILMAIGAIGGLAVIWKIVIPFIGNILKFITGNK